MKKRGFGCCLRGAMWGLLPLVLIGAGAWFLSRSVLEEKLAADAREKMRAAGHDWAQAEAAGRDLRLRGAAPSRAAAAGAAAAALSVYGVRQVDASGVVVRLSPPTVNRVSAAKAPVVLTGTWPEGSGASLKVTVAGKTYVPGASSPLTTDGKGGWKLVLDKLPPDGVYDVVAATVDDGDSAPDATSSELMVDTTPPAVPKLTSAALAGGAPLLTGVWPEGDAKSLTVSVGRRTYALGKDAELVSDGKGNWKLTGRKKLADGVYDVVVTVADAMGNRATLKKAAALVVDTTPPAAPSVVSAELLSGGGALLRGRWAEGDAKTLKVRLAGRTYILGRSAELTSDGKGGWTLKTAQALPDGAHDVTVESADAAGNVSSAVKTRALVVDATPPAPPTFAGAEVKDGFAVMKGGWAEGDAKSLTAMFDGRTYRLGESQALKSDGRGHWTFAPGYRLEPGEYTLWMEARDAAGNAASAVFGSVVKIAAPKPEPKPEPEPEPKPEPKQAVDTTPPEVLYLREAALMEDRRVTLTGGWDEGDAVSLKAVFNGRTYTLGESPELTSDGKGGWTLTPREKLAPGSYDLTLAEADAAGNVTKIHIYDAVSVRPAVDTTPPAAPTVVSLMTRRRRPQISGSWPSSDARLLQVELAGRTYTYRKGAGDASAALRVTGDSWTLIPESPLPDGVYDVRATVADAAGNRAQDASRNELVVDATSPAAPTVRPQATPNRRVTLTGSWPEGDARTLAVTVAGRTYVLGAAGSPLRKAGKGLWKLKLPEALKPGVYDVKVVAADALGNASHDQTVNELLVKAPPKVVRPAVVTAPKKTQISCQTKLDDILKRTEIRFESDKARIRPESLKLLDELARIANSCPKTIILIAGHTDATGSETYNQSLSERRAAAVSRALSERGVSPARLEAVGYGESRPIADNATPEGRARNRRIEFFVRPAGQK